MITRQLTAMMRRRYRRVGVEMIMIMMPALRAPAESGAAAPELALNAIHLFYCMFLHGITFPQAIAGVAVMAYQTVQSLSIRLRD